MNRIPLVQPQHTKPPGHQQSCRGRSRLQRRIESLFTAEKGEGGKTQSANR